MSSDGGLTLKAARLRGLSSFSFSFFSERRPDSPSSLLSAASMALPFSSAGGMAVPSEALVDAKAEGIEISPGRAGTGLLAWPSVVEPVTGM